MCNFPGGFEAETRESLQRRIDRIERLIRRRLRRKLGGGICGGYDEDDILSSMRRRLDLAHVSGMIRAETTAELEAYAQRVAERVALDALRRQRRDGSILESMGRALSAGEDRSSTDPPRAADSSLRKLDDAGRTAIVLWARGIPPTGIAAALGIGHEALRSRLRRLRKGMRADA